MSLFVKQTSLLVLAVLCWQCTCCSSGEHAATEICKEIFQKHLQRMFRGIFYLCIVLAVLQCIA